MTTKSYLVGSDEVYLAGLACFLRPEGFEILGSCLDLSEIESSDLDEDILTVVDCPKPGDQVEAVKTIRALYHCSRVVVLADTYDWDTMIQCFEAGAQGYILRSLKPYAIIASLRLAALGEKVLPSEVVGTLDQHFMSVPSTGVTDSTLGSANLSLRELDVLCCLMAGFSNKQIARQLDICEATVKVHVKAILRKLKVMNRTQAAIWGKSHGVVRFDHCP